ncbi:MAG: GNAT family N-acetyltransferase [Clostridia bacterium]|nr:GNAT family N-acetyltransferase [Clostridia bacterium]
MRFSEAEHNELIEFYRQNGLEVSSDIAAEDGAVYSIKSIQNGRLQAAATLSLRFGVYILDYIAVDSKFRGRNLGALALKCILEKAKGFGADKLFITARNPSFFEHFGFKEGSPDGVDMNADCVGCPEYNNGCLKKPMYIDIR